MNLITRKQNLDRDMTFLNDNNLNNKEITDICEKYFKVREEERKWYSEVIKALEQAEKYKWHDLRKNPSDLPKEKADFVQLIMLKNGKHYHYVKSKDRNKVFWGVFGKGTEEYFETIAWQYIEPFESEES